LAAPLQPIKRAGQPEDIAKMVAFLIDNEQSGFITGWDHSVDGGVATAGGLNYVQGNPVSDAFEYVDK